MLPARPGLLSSTNVHLVWLAMRAANTLDPADAADSPFEERALLVTGARVIVYEQAVRFLADHLDGERWQLLGVADDRVHDAAREVARNRAAEPETDLVDAYDLTGEIDQRAAG